jgi:hypothetical protein
MLLSGAGRVSLTPITARDARLAEPPRPSPFALFDTPGEPSVSIPVRSPVRLIDPRGQRFGAAGSAIVLAIAIALDLPVVVALVAIALGVSSALGTRYFVFGRPWPSVRNLLRLGPPAAPEPEVGPRFAQALGATFLALGFVLLALGVRPAGWLPVGAVVALQTLLAVTGYCLGCRLYGLQWWVPEQFDRFVLRRTPTTD